MMFSCSQYPSTPEFLKVVDAEVRYQVKRLGSHAYVALWCGDTGHDFFYVLEAKQKGAAAFDNALRMTVMVDKYKRYDLPESTVKLAAGGKPGIFILSADKPAFFVKPEASEFGGAFDGASFTLLPGESRTVAFRSFDGRVPEISDVAVSHVAATYR